MIRFQQRRVEAELLLPFRSVACWPLGVRFRSARSRLILLAFDSFRVGAVPVGYARSSLVYWFRIGY